MRLIDADAFERAVMFSDDEDIQDVIYRLRDFPTVDVIPIEWIKEQKDKCFPYSITERELNDLLIKWERREDER